MRKPSLNAVSWRIVGLAVCWVKRRRARKRAGAEPASPVSRRRMAVSTAQRQKRRMPAAAAVQLMGAAEGPHVELCAQQKPGVVDLFRVEI